MKSIFPRAILLAVAAILAQSFAVAQTDSQWTIEQSTLTYHVSSPVHEVDGGSHDAKGRGICGGGWCNLLIAVPVKSFITGDTNRDLHMLEATRGAEFPFVQVRARFPESDLNSQWIHADLEVQFAGQTAHYSNVAFERAQQGKDLRITGTIPLTCSDFKIERPTFLAMAINNDIPVQVDMTWKPV